MSVSMKDFSRTDWMGLSGAVQPKWGGPPMIGYCTPVGLFSKGDSRQVVLSGTLDRWGSVCGTSIGIIGDSENDDFLELVLELGDLPKHYCLLICDEVCTKGLPSLKAAREMGWRVI